MTGHHPDIPDELKAPARIPASTQRSLLDLLGKPIPPVPASPRRRRAPRALLGAAAVLFVAFLSSVVFHGTPIAADLLGLAVSCVIIAGLITFSNRMSDRRSTQDQPPGGKPG
ncbi:MAG: hypothetical protein QOE17_84 [Gaiellales bacterium]|jgi:hypothetical protein|nr:hypothetical protein [Gaiellales bacterium]